MIWSSSFEKNHFRGEILYRILHPPKKRRQKKKKAFLSRSDADIVETAELPF